ncbi:dTDP-4-dehydrorhamnose 3,5-epimerase [Polaromonas sp.]|jgi:dTDP-4-dehydrorhamnose 3,5-epimerase|uniref:dTDP-4-dehydrorhamnose 3,5-epimerase n=1 Tax=Polaromonas sp. TaxID=1869339 RepID=UPI0037CADBEB
MKVVTTSLAGLLVIEPKCFADERGFFMETYQERKYRAAGIVENFVQDNHSRSAKGILRGMHFTKTRPQAQIVTVMHGRVFDAAVDLRKTSATFGQWFGVELGDEGPRQVYMPPGFAHGFYVLSEWADLHYKVSEYYDADDEGGLLWSDPEIAIPWPAGVRELSARDARYPLLKDLHEVDLPDAVFCGRDESHSSPATACTTSSVISKDPI